MRARSALFTLFGDVVRPAGGDAWLTTLTACMGVLGFTPEATRTALHRMAAEGWVSLSRVGRFSAYRLTPRGVDRLEEAAARIYRLRAVEWDGRWRLLLAPAAGRDQEASRALRWMGFGRLSGDVWISPHPHGDRLARVLDSHRLSDKALRFVADGGPQAEADARIVATAWELSELRQAHGDFIAQWGGVEAPHEPAAAFVTRIRLVHHWRSFLFLDPGLPPRLLPADWLGEEAAAVFRRLYEAVAEPGWRFYEEVAGGAPPLPGGSGGGARQPAASPFARGLDALHTSRSATA